MTDTVVGIGTSWGGLAALGRILADLPAGFPASLLVVQHRSKDSDDLLAKLLQDVCDLSIHEAEDKDALLPANVYVAPPDYHMLVDLGQISLTTDAPVRYSRPSIDVTFESMARAYGSSAIGVVLTGANQDGARGLARVVELGGRGIVQDPTSSEVAIMPAAAKLAVPGADVLPLEAIAPRLIEMVNERGRTARKAG